MSAESEANKATLYRYFKELMNDAKLAVIEEMMDENIFFTIPTTGDVRGRGQYKDLVNLLHTAFPDLHFTTNDVFAEGDTIACRWTATGTFTGTFLGKPGTGKPFTIEGIGLYRFKNGRFVDNRVNEDTLGLLIQCGIIPPPGQG